MANVPAGIKNLVETFDRNIETYRSQQYNETQLRREFIDPFFEALGWDVTNIAGNAQAYKDVIHEDAIKIGGATKAPDYCFRIGGVRKFFLEAKKPSLDIKGNPHPAYQLRRYAWSAKLPLSILTDFEEFAVYDCQTRPKQTDKPAAARVPAEKTRIQRQINNTDSQIDKLTYDLYNLTDEEIAIVEEATRRSQSEQN